jgi:hypothetical protein
LETDVDDYLAFILTYMNRENTTIRYARTLIIIKKSVKELAISKSVTRWEMPKRPKAIPI